MRLKPIIYFLAFSVWIGPTYRAFPEERNGIDCNVTKVTLDRADMRLDLNSANIDRTMGLKVTLKNNGFREIPAGELTWQVLKRHFNTPAFELIEGSEKCPALRTGERTQIVIGAIHVIGIRNGAVSHQDELEWQLILKIDDKEYARFVSKPTFAIERRRAMKLDAAGNLVPAPPPKD